MNYITAAENYLLYYRDLRRSVDLLTKEISRLKWRNAPQDIKGINYEGVKVQTSMYDDTINNLFKIQEYQSMIQDTQAELDIIYKLLDEIEKEEPGYGQLLRKWYIEKQNRIKIAMDMGYNETYIYGMKDKAIRKFAVNLFGIDVVKAHI